MNELRVAKDQTAAAFYLTNSTVLRGTVFLAEYAAHHSGRQTLGDLLRDSEAMIPVIDQQGQFVLVGLASVVAAEVAHRDAALPQLVVNVPVQIHASGGHRFDGAFLLDQGAGDRLSDVVNSTSGWIPLESPSGVAWISKQHIVTARPRA